MVEHANGRKAVLYERKISPFSSREPDKKWQWRARMARLAVTFVIVLLVVFLSACGGTSSSTSQSTPRTTSISQIKKHDTCAVQATLPASLPDPQGSFNTGADVITVFNNARQQEGCSVPLSIDPGAYDAATSQQQVLMVFNAERQDRGLPAVNLDQTLLSQIALNHSKELAQYNYENNAHQSPINQPGGKNSVGDRLNVNSVLTQHSHQPLWAETVFYGAFSAGVTGANSVYWWMYQDAPSGWGHRKAILGYDFTIDANPGHFTWVGIGVATGGKWGHYYTIDYLDDANSTKYTPPTTADTQPPKLNPPTVVDANTVQVTGVQDDSDGRTDGVAGVSSVVFYVSSAVAADGSTFQTVSATQTTSGTWTANLAVTDPTTLHVVAVDGSGNYTDCVVGGATC